MEEVALCKIGELFQQRPGNLSTSKTEMLEIQAMETVIKNDFDRLIRRFHAAKKKLCTSQEISRIIQKEMQGKIKSG